ncbi:MAG: rod shape-determining protein MreD [Alphaproteobacteria bacterium]|nr:rod shape-determining protein MreD [Alphaproteobacteria bacterium]
MDRTPGIQPRPTLARRLDIAARASFPAVSALLLVVLLGAPLALPAQPDLQLGVVLACVYFWSLYRPASLPPPLVFLLGAVADLLGNGPLGPVVLILLIVHGLVLRWRRFLVRQGFLLVWIAFALLALAAVAADWTLTSLLAFTLMPVAPAAFQAAVAIGIYPALAMLLTIAHRGVAAPELA